MRERVLKLEEAGVIRGYRRELVVFRGPDANVSPSLHATKKETRGMVPTWNYAMVRARGKLE